MAFYQLTLLYTRLFTHVSCRTFALDHTLYLPVICLLWTDSLVVDSFFCHDEFCFANDLEGNI